ncbi:MAG: peptide deformylase [Oscillospiraceae bacterium]|nr:peptide deformylase [Oscillospiraceae bacterium]
MSIRTILTQDAPELSKKCHPITSFNDRLFDLLGDLKQTLTDANGAGLAAPQIGIMRRVALVLDDDETYIELVNPVVLEMEGEQSGYEGCLSVPGMWGIVKRPMRVKIRAQDRHGNEFELEREGMTARCFCHEIEHLDGVLFTAHTDQLYTSEEVDKMLEEEKKKEEPEPARQTKG